MILGKVAVDLNRTVDHVVRRFIGSHSSYYSCALSSALVLCKPWFISITIYQQRER